MDSMFVVDPNKCKRNGICAQSCRLKLIKISEKDKLPFWIEGAEEKCLYCKHCVTVCPNQAISLKTKKHDDEGKKANNLFEIDPQKCKRDGICATVCPLKLITVNEKDKLPRPIDRAEKQCINCGHCVIACPYGALSLKILKPGALNIAVDGTLFYEPISLQTMKPEECTLVNRNLLPSAEQVRRLLTTRRSVRAYKNQPVDRATLSGIIDTARYAPTGVNLQPVNWLVIEDNSKVSRLAGLVIDWLRYVIKEEPEVARSMNMKRLVADWDNGIDRICHRAPHVIVAHAEEGLTGAQTSCTIALTYLELAAFSVGLGTCRASFFNAAANSYSLMMTDLNLPEGHQCFGAMTVGYPQHQYHRLPMRKKAVVTWR